jgi:hypothetical protein
MKNSLKLVLFLATLWIIACKNDSTNSTATKTAETPPAAATTTTVDTTKTAAQNPVTAAALMGKWVSNIDPKSKLEFKEKGIYRMIYDKEVVEEGSYEIPAACACDDNTPDGCFFFVSEDGKDCCSIAGVTADHLSYFVIGSTGRIQSFKRDK